MNHELQALEMNCTWTLTPLLPGKKAISCKWVYKIKLKVDGSVERYKVQLVAKGYNQVEGIDYMESFSPVAKAVTVRIFLAIVVEHSWAIQQLDINNSFLHGYLDEDVYMFPREGYHAAPEVKDYLHDLFTIKDLGDTRYFLGLEIARNPSVTYVAQTKYVIDIVKDTKLLHSKSDSTPFPQGLKLSADFRAKLEHPNAYRRFVGRLLYLSFTRPDISHCIQQLSQFLNHPCKDHWVAALHVVKYLKGCPSKGFFFPLIMILFSLPIATRTGPRAQTLADHSLDFVFFWVLHLFLGRQRNKPPFLARRWRPNTEVWLLQSVNYVGFHIF
ncbi:UNVERIFIED_CONTAM: hypothetical protein Scaly_0589100 [Sesamum calycinum]|uniref:Reverse transcriptase Ty1/copia-type domain-containing protein n=1 Tax=Sesamum calycinum TaxID=2727403 RepID=A0AAW2RSL7_9LAMI